MLTQFVHEIWASNLRTYVRSLFQSIGSEWRINETTLACMTMVEHFSPEKRISFMGQNIHFLGFVLVCLSVCLCSGIRKSRKNVGREIFCRKKSFCRLGFVLNFSVTFRVAAVIYFLPSFKGFFPLLAPANPRSYKFAVPFVVLL